MRTQTDGRTDMTKLIVDFRNFVNALKNSLPLPAMELQFLGVPVRVLDTINPLSN
jgi:hypothetical protein